jgi:predicted glycosyltransferase
MRHTFFVNTPAHAHLYKYPVRRLRDRGHDVQVMAREDGCATELLTHAGVDFEVYGKRRDAPGSLLVDVPVQYARIFRRVRDFSPDLVFGMGAYAAPAGAVSGAPVVAIQDSEPHTLDYTLSRAIVDAFLTPHTFRRDLGTKHYRFHGFKECAYLHPSNFESQVDIRAKLGLRSDEPYVIARFNSWGAYHDIGQSGFGPAQRTELLSALSDHASVVVSDEGGDTDGLPPNVTTFDAHPAYMHDALADASLLVSDTQTMVTEAAMLGTPAIRSNSFVGESDMGNFIELEDRGLIDNTESVEELLDRAETVLTDETVRDDWYRRYERYVPELANLSDLIVDVALSRDPADHLESRRTETVPTAVTIE